MPLHESLKVSPKIPLYSLIFTSVFVVFISIVCLLNGITIVFQNLYYFPIIIACAFYLRKGFIFSLVLIGVYVILIALFGPHQSEVYSALARIAIFILVAGVVTWLSSRYSEQTSDLMVSEKKFRRLFDANDAGIALHEVICDSTGKAIDYRFINVNPAYEQMTGLKASDIIGKTVREVFPGNEDDWIETCSDVTAMEKKIHFEYFNRKLGRYYEGTAYSPEPERLVRIIRDVTERKQQEYQLLETNAYLENLITHANVPIIIWDTGFSITRVNHAFEILTGRPAGHLVGRHLSSLFPQDEAERSMQFIQKTGEGVRWETVEIPIIHQDGTLRTVLWNSATIYDSDGKNPVATIAQGRDVTAERFLEREKERAAVQIQENIAQLAILNDGIRNPLTLISIYADMSEDVRITAQIQNEVKRIDEMVTNLDREWVHSGKILDYLRNHDMVAFDFVPSYSPGSPVPSEAPPPDRPEQVISSPQVSGYERYIEEIQARLYSILDSVDAYIFVSDLDSYDILYINEEGRNIFGNVIGQKCHTCMYDNADSPCSFCTNKFILEKTDPTGLMKGEFIHPKTGRWYDCRGRARDELIQASRYHRTLIETSPDPLITIGRDGKITDVNTATETVSGYTRSELVGTDFSEYFTEPEEARAGYLMVFEKGEVRDYPLAIRKKDGAIIDVLYNASVYLNEMGEIAGVFTTARDITERKKVEKKLYQQEERYRLALQATNDVIWDFDVINDAQRWNEVGIEVFGWSDIVFSDQTAAWWTDRVHPEDRERVAEGFDTALEDPTCTNWHDEYRFRRSDGVYAYVMDRGCILRNPGGVAIRMIGAMLDISERKKAEEALRHANRQINLLSSITRHDIINKTTVIFNSLGAAEMDISDPSVLHQIDVIRSATQAIKSQIEFTRVYPNLGTHEPQWSRLETLRLSIPINVEYTSMTGDYEVYADPMFSQVFSNLLDNSLRHGERVTRIMLTTHLEEDSLIIRWEDNGAGIPFDQKEQIFERGFGKNNGFGLFLVREVLQITGMSIRETGNFGSGAVFEIIVPKGVYRTMHPTGE